jgi:hypothetical protein
MNIEHDQIVMLSQAFGLSGNTIGGQFGGIALQFEVVLHTGGDGGFVFTSKIRAMFYPPDRR